MAYFKLNPIQRDKYTDMGMINISANLYLEKGDLGYDKYIAEHRVQVPVIPEGGYPGEMKEVETFIVDKVSGEKVQIESIAKEPVDKEDYEKWFESLPRVQQLNPFCNHSIQFEHDVTEEEILWCFEFALGITHRNYLADDLHCQKKDENGKPHSQIVNQPFGYSARRAFYEGMKLIPKEKQSDYMKVEMLKVDKVSARLTEIQEVDFTKVKTIEKYKVK